MSVAAFKVQLDTNNVSITSSIIVLNYDDLCKLWFGQIVAMTTILLVC